MKPKSLYLVLLVFFTFISCEKMDSTYDEFIVPGGIDYPGKVLFAEVYPGKNRVKLSWVQSSDPNIAQTRIFWNNYQDSLEVEMAEIGRIGDTLSVILDELPEKSSYSFIFKTYNHKGNASVPVEVLAPVYGTAYQENLKNRSVAKSELSGAGGMVSIHWGEADISSGADATEVKYIDLMGVTRTEIVPVNETTTSISMKEGTTYQYRTTFIPESSIDTFYTSFVENKLYYLSKDDWSVTEFSTEHPGGENMATNVIDGNPATRWHTYAGQSFYPHFITIDLGSEQTISIFEIFRMKDDDRAPDTFQLFASHDNLTWTDLGVFDFNRNIDQGQLFEIPSQPKARYFKLVGLSGPHDYMVLGEISLLYQDTIPE